MAESWEFLAAKVANLERQVSRMSKVVSPTGGLAADVFSFGSEQFSVLPHDAASLFNGSSTTIPTGTTVTVTFNPLSGATWGHGMEIDPSSGFIRVHGANNNSILLIVASLIWDGNSSGIRDLKLRTDDGAERVDRQAAIGTSEVYSQITHIRRTPTATTEYHIDVSQDSGGDLGIDSMNLTVVRLR